MSVEAQALEIPEFTLAKVGPRRDKERKKSGFWFWLNGAGAGGGGVAGLGAGGGLSGLLGLGGLLAKAVVAMLLAALALSAYNLGRSLAPAQEDAGSRAFVPRERPALDASAQAPSSLPGQPSGLSMISGALDGKTGEQRAAEAAAAQAAADAAAQPAPPAAAPAPVVDANAAAADALKASSEESAKADAGKFAGKFGQLSTSVGGGGTAASHPSLAGGMGMAGGLNGKFDPSKLGATRGFGAPARPAKSSAKPASQGRRNRAFQQLRNASQLSRAGSQAGASETASTNADMPFSNNPAVASVVTGGGAGAQNASGAGAGDGGPLGGTNADGTKTADDAQHQNSTPWKNSSRQAAGALLIASTLIMIAKFLPSWMAVIALMIAAALGSFAMGLGNQISSQGGGPQGKLLVAGGLAAMGGSAAGSVGSVVAMWTGVAGGLLSGVIGAKVLMQHKLN